MTQVAIPGKVMLSGEYAVLYGGTAVLVPAPRELVLREAEPGESGDRTPVLEHALTLVIPELVDAEAGLPPLAVTLDRSQFLGTTPEGRSAKLGLGGSAAEAVAVIALRFERAGMNWKDQPRRVFELADAAHRAAQGGLGSGADVACCAYRRPIRFRRDGDQVEIAAIPAPRSEHDVPLSVVWTGRSANTRVLVKPFQAWAVEPRNQSALRTWIRLMDTLSERWYCVEPDLLRASVAEIMAATIALMANVGVDWHIPLGSDLDELIRRHGGIVKPTGAGGGDMVLVVGDVPLEDRPEVILPLGFEW